MSCEHERIGVKPGHIENVGDKVAINLDGGEVFCSSCDEALPFEDMYLYDKSNIDVLIPTEYVDGEDV